MTHFACLVVSEAVNPALRCYKNVKLARLTYWRIFANPTNLRQNLQLFEKRVPGLYRYCSLLDIFIICKGWTLKTYDNGALAARVKRCKRLADE